VYLAGLPAAVPPASVSPSAAGTPEQAWLAVQNSDSVAVLEEFRRQYPNNSFEPFAAAKIEELKRQRLAVVAPPVRPAMPDPAPSQDVRRFDGIWTGVLTCERTLQGLPGWKYELVGHISNGVFHSERGPAGNPGSETFDGKLQPDGSVRIIQKGLTGDTERDHFQRPKGTVYGSAYAVKFDASQGKGIRLDRSSCNVAFTRSAAGPDVHRFDGNWITTIVCGPVGGDVRGWSNKFFTNVKNSEFRVQTGPEGMPGWTDHYGKIESDGGIEIQAKGLTGDSKFAVDHVAAGTPFGWKAFGRLDEAHGKATRIEGRPCTLDFDKQVDSSAARTVPSAERPRRNR
jgi:hypothetical protein